MRWHLRVLLLCITAALLWSCSRNDRPDEPATQTTFTSPNFSVLDCPSLIGNLVWLDLDCDGLQDKEEPGASGVES